MRGLPNMGTTCYLNSILQIIFNDQELAQDFTKKLPIGAETIGMHFRDLIKLYHSNCNDMVINKHFMIFNKYFSKYFEMFSSGHHDQHEYLLHLLDKLHDVYAVKSHFSLTGNCRGIVDEQEKIAIENMRITALTARFIPIADKPDIAYVSPVSNNFVGQMHHRTECINCGYISHQYEVFTQLSVYIKNPGKTSVTLDECLHEFTGITQISDGEENMYECNSCKTKNRSRRRLTIWRLPKILCICLRRHIYDGNRPHKDNRLVDAPMELDMAPYLSHPLAETKYNLRSIANHEGAPHFGHCYSLINTKQGWVVVNDESITAATKIISPANYIYFYKRK